MTRFNKSIQIFCSRLDNRVESIIMSLIINIKKGVGIFLEFYTNFLIGFTYYTFWLLAYNTNTIN